MFAASRRRLPLAATIRKIVLCCALCACSLVVHGDTLTGTVVGVSDGDTITVLDGNRERHKIRVAGIDAPEKAQPFGTRSKQSLAALVLERDVDIEWRKRDRYRRIVGKVLVAEPGCVVAACPKVFDAGLAQINAGLAWWYAQYAKDQSFNDARHYALAEKEAHLLRAGLWSEAEPWPPWDWRKEQRAAHARRSLAAPG